MPGDRCGTPEDREAVPGQSARAARRTDRSAAEPHRHDQVLVRLVGLGVHDRLAAQQRGLRGRGRARAATGHGLVRTGDGAGAGRLSTLPERCFDSPLQVGPACRDSS